MGAFPSLVCGLTRVSTFLLRLSHRLTPPMLIRGIRNEQRRGFVIRKRWQPQNISPAMVRAVIARKIRNFQTPSYVRHLKAYAGNRQENRRASTISADAGMSSLAGQFVLPQGHRGLFHPAPRIAVG
jgi:hypothetical protein